MCSTTLTSNIVREWLKSLCLGQYADSFIDNGYDDLEICKQIGDPDLDAIGVFNPVHRTRLLESVRTLREEGAASVYFTLEETVATVQDECYCDSVSAHSQTSSSEKETTVTVASASAATVVANVASSSDNSGRNVVVMTTSPGSEGSSGIRQMDEYEEGKAELVRIPRIKLQALLRDKLSQDGIRLSCQPYSTTDGERGYLEGLASRYADLFCTHYGDVLNHLEELRKKELTEISSQDKSLSTTPNRKYANVTAISNAGITSSQSQPIYVPGKYSPSSCLSDKEEDEIYGFGYGVFGVQIARQQQQRIMAAAEQGNNSQQLNQHFYQTCLSPRSAFFYEFPPNENANYANTGKKRTTFSRFLRGLKTAHRKEKHGGSSPRHGRATSGGAVPQRVDTPDSVLQSGLGLPADLAQSNVLRSMIDPRDYDRLRYLQMNGGGPSTFEETIYRLKVQEAQKKREKITKEHEEILRNIREGLMHLGKGTFRGHLTADDTYMYDEDVRMLAPATYDRGHWYDEPPYESDPEDFLMRGSPGPTATIENGRVCFTLNQRQEQYAEGIISLRSAGDISLPKEGNGRGITGHSKCRKLLISRRDDESPSLTRMRESGDYAGSDIQSVSSRISTLSMDTSRSEQLELMHFDDNLRKYHKKGGFDRLHSPNQSSDYEDQEDYDSCNPQIATIHMSDEGRMGVSNLVGRVRGLREDVQKKISKLRNESSTDQEKRFDHTFPCSASSVESIPSGSGSSTQALVRAGSNHSSISVEDVDSSPADPQIIGRARALVDYTPTPYDKEALKFKKGDIIDILSMNASGQWKGICHGQKGTFKFINVELMSERSVRTKRESKWHYQIKNKPKSVEDLLQRIGMPEHISVFVLNGYEDLELFKEIEPSDLDYLGILNSDHRAKLLAAVQLLHDMDSGSEGDVAGSSSEGDDHSRIRLLCSTSSEPFNRCHFSRESGSYSGKTLHCPKLPPPSSNLTPKGDFNNLDAVVEQCSNEIIARVRQSHKNTLNLKEEPCYQPNITDNPMPNFLNNEKIQHESLDQQGITKGARKGGRLDEFGGADDQKLTTVKYIVGGNIEMGIGDTMVSTANVIGKGGCFSEKSSDSGISSSSMCSTNTKDSLRQPLAVHTDNLSRFSTCANRASSKMTK